MCLVTTSPDESITFHNLSPGEDEREFRALPIGSCERGTMSVDDHHSSTHGAHGFWERFGGTIAGLRSTMTKIVCCLVMCKVT